MPDSCNVREFIHEPPVINVQSASGIVRVDSLPIESVVRDYTQHPSPDFDYMYNHIAYKPGTTADYSGWYVYGIINHLLNLKEKDVYLINLANLKKFVNILSDIKYFGEDWDTDMFLDMDDNSILEALDAVLFLASQFIDQDVYCQDEGLNPNQIILHGVYKPDLIQYNGGVKPPQTIVYLNNPAAWSGLTNYAVDDVCLSAGTEFKCTTAHINKIPPNPSYWIPQARKVKTNIIYKYLILKKG